VSAQRAEKKWATAKEKRRGGGENWRMRGEGIIILQSFQKRIDFFRKNMNIKD
jgi:hypothetical protein